jgi:nitrile hydratase
LPHDIGGHPGNYGHIEPDKSLLFWEQQCHSLFVVLATKKIVGTDELRRAIEALTPNQYESWSYYEKWSAAMASLLLEKGVLTHNELQQGLFGDDTTLKTTYSSSPLYKAGDSVRVKCFQHGIEWKRPHIRTPGYIYGVSGTIERICGKHGDPSFLGFGLEAPQVQLYRVRFRQQDVWPEQTQAGNDVVEVEVYEHWLETADTSVGHDFENQTLFDHSFGDDCTGHSHKHHHHGEEVHDHEPRSMVEERAIRNEGPPRPGKELHQALVKLLLAKKAVTCEEIRIVSERMDTAGKKLDGSTLVVEAWLDPCFEELLLADAAAAASTIGISTSNPNATTVLTVVKNTTTTHNLVVCTLCSCYPSGLLGIAPSWYKSRAYRSRAVREPRNVLKEFGLSIEKPIIRIHDSTADHRYIVLPERPLGTEDWSKEELRALITRDTMIGVSVPFYQQSRN